MLVTEFSETCFQYSHFEVWQIDNLDAFFKGNTILEKIFEDYYKMPLVDLKTKRSDIQDTDIMIITKLLAQVDDKHFFIFTLHDENHLELIKMQKLNIMNFGLDIEKISPDKVFVMLMDKKMQEHLN
ncbi:hypothetical protein FLAV_00589 [Flavobacteriales bacterium]|nr:hypothetical protein [Flavobacteriales bacterium]MCL4815442.1 hypothetical protein [Flavobacteriales bacterium]WKZ75061.1 MAG: hypothetical protein QY303_13030 [Vicingaceae bacterium]GIK70003.1 MAG: hypothetical protein BroJett020_12980 [Bacteroidota bacterium]CAG0958893.1 hypothetical protein FLAV_00589 [Flavobacteriales bacterium]